MTSVSPRGRRPARGITDIRASTQTILDNRSRRDSTILVTGGAGFIGSHVVVELLRKGYPILLLVRRQKSLPADERVHRLLEWFGVDRKDASRLRVLEGDLDDPSLGLDKARYAELTDVTDEIVHCASDTSFSERKRAAVEKANVANLEHVLALAARSRCCFFHHVSTAYVAGKKTGQCREELVETREFTNVYEETKYVAERNAVVSCRNEGIRLNIYRPSVVYGDSRTGRTTRFNAVYYPVKTVVFFRDVYEKDLKERGGKKAREMGVTIDESGLVHLPLRVEATRVGGINLIPIDYFVRAFTAIMGESLEGGIFHIVNTKLTTIEKLAEFTERFFRVDGIRAVQDSEFLEVPRNGLEILFDQYVEAYGPYMKDRRVFENSKTEAILGKRGIACPDFDYGIFSKCMQYAVDVDWGMKLFDPVR